MFRLPQLAIVCVVLSQPCVALAQGAAVSGPVRVAAPKMTPGGSPDTAGATAACNNTVFGTSLSTIQRYQITYVYALTEYNTQTCKLIDKGKWTSTTTQTCTPPGGGTAGECGKVTYGTVTAQLANGDCPGRTFSFASICYTWNKHIDWQVTDQIASTWVSTDYTMPEVFPVTVPIVYPSSETTTAKGWDSAVNGQWQQTLHSASDPSIDWSGSSVQETDPGPDNPANDRCWCKGSAIDQFYRITGGLWGPSSAGGDFGPKKGGAWGYDHVGFGSDAYAYYRMKQRAPCGTHLYQQMQFQATQVSGAPFVNYGAVNTLGGSFNDQTVTSLRAGKFETESYDPGTTQTHLTCAQIKWPTKAADRFGDIAAIDDPRPVAAAIEKIETLAGRPVSYEDAPLADPRAMAPMVTDRSGDTHGLVPRRGNFQVVLPADASAASEVVAVEGLVAAYNARGQGARFAVRQGDFTHVVPRAAANEAGVLVAVTPVLDTRITLEAKPRSGAELLAEILRMVGSATGQALRTGTVPTNLLAQASTGVGAVNEPARQVLERLVAATGKPLSWRLMYDPGLKSYYLNIHEVQKVVGRP
jgi:hypothetical protein